MSQATDKFIKENLELCEGADYGDFGVSASHVLPKALKALEIARSQLHRVAWYSERDYYDSTEAMNMSEISKDSLTEIEELLQK